MKQIGHNLTDSIDGFLAGIRRLIMGRDAVFSAEFRKFLKQESIKGVRLPLRWPNLNPYFERLNGSIRRECLAHVIVHNDSHLRRVFTSYFAHYHHVRAHLSFDRDSPIEGEVEPTKQGTDVAIPKVGGPNRRYRRAACALEPVRPASAIEVEVHALQIG